MKIIAPYLGVTIISNNPSSTHLTQIWKKLLAVQAALADILLEIPNFEDIFRQIPRTFRLRIKEEEL